MSNVLGRTGVQRVYHPVQHTLREQISWGFCGLRQVLHSDVITYQPIKCLLYVFHIMFSGLAPDMALSIATIN